MSCSRAICDLCFRFTLDERPACARCAYETSTRPQRRISLAMFFLTFAGGVGFWLTRRYGLWPDQALSLAFAGVVAVFVAGWIALTARDSKRADVKNREPDDEPVEGALEGSANPYRAQVRRVVLAVSPRVSGKVTALVVVLSLVASAALVPASLRLPRWIEAEMVLFLWWLVMAATLVVLLYRGFRLQDDLVYFMPWDRPSLQKEEKTAPGQSSAKGSSWSFGPADGCSLDVGNGCSGADGEGVIVVIVAGVVLIVALGAAWLVVEIALPLAFFFMYSLLMRAIRRAARDRKGCTGHLMKSLGWGVLWATIYIVPLALFTWGVHVVKR